MAFASPPVLFRSILRAHKRHLPTDLRSLGDVYVKQEFRLHKTAKPEQALQFMNEWSHYLDQLSMTARARDSVRVGAVDNDVFDFGKNLPRDVELSEEQLQQLETLREEAAKARK
ncbi:acetate non-utilizing protein 9 [Mayamaea pseudoterrestris]|nr:acetate non-utilizing protein 9 [Mayamaea pseudoterrestris]